MKHTHYFVHVGHGTQTKNNLQKDFDTYLKSLEGTLIDKDKLQNLKNAIVEKSKELNALHMRCTPLNVAFYKLHSGKGFTISGYYFLTFHILQAYHDGN